MKLPSAHQFQYIYRSKYVVLRFLTASSMLILDFRRVRSFPVNTLIRSNLSEATKSRVDCWIDENCNKKIAIVFLFVTIPRSLRFP